MGGGAATACGPLCPSGPHHRGGAQPAAAAGRIGRQSELEQLRASCLPRVCFQLLQQLQAAGDWNSCLTLLELITDDHLDAGW